MSINKDAKKSSWTKFLFDCFIPREVKSTGFLITLEVFSQIQILANLILFMQTFGSKLNTEYIGSSLVNVLEVLACNPSDLSGSVIRKFTEFILVLIMVYLVGLLVFILVSLFCTKSEDEVALKTGHVIKMAFNLHSKALFLPGASFMFQVIKLSFEEDSLLFGNKVAYGFRAMIVIFLLLHLVLAFIPGLLNFQPMKTPFFFSHRPCAIDILDIVFKCLCAIFTTLSSQPLVPWVFFVLNCAVFAIKMNIVIKLNPFHHLRGQMVMLAFYASHLTANLLNLVFMSMPNLTNVEPVIVHLFTVPVMTQAVLMIFRLDLEKLVSTTTLNIHETHAKILAVAHILEFSTFQNSSQNNYKFKKEEFIFMNLVNIHAQTCSKPKCYCKYFTEKAPYSHVNFVSDFESDLENFKFVMMKQCYLDIINLGGEMCNVWIILDFIALVMTLQPEAFSIVLGRIFHLKLGKLGKLEKFFVDGMINRIIMEINTSIIASNAQLDANLFFEFKFASTDFRASLTEATDQSLSFWNLYKAVSPNFSKIYKLSLEVNKKFTVIAQKWLTLKAYYGQLLFKEYRLYATFLALVQNSPKASREMVFQFNSFVKHKASSLNSPEHITRDSVQEERNVTMSMSLNHHTLGQITAVSSNIRDAYGWHNNDLIGASVNKVIPPFLRDHHSNCLKDHLSSGRNRIILTNQLVFVQHYSGHVVPTFLYITPHPDIQKEFCYVGILRAARRKFEYIIINDKAEALSWTLEIGKELGLTISRSVLDTSLWEDESSSKALSIILEKRELKEDNTNILNRITNAVEDKLELIGKSGSLYYCHLEKSEAIEMENIQILVLEKSTNKPRSKIIEEENTQLDESDLSVHAQIAVRNPSDSPKDKEVKKFETKSTYLEQKNLNDTTFHEALEIPVKSLIRRKNTKEKELAKAKQVLVEVDQASEQDYKESSEQNSMHQENYEAIFNVYQQSTGSSMTSRKSSQWRECHEIDLLIQEKPKAKRLTFLTAILVLNSISILGGTIFMNSYASQLVNQNGQIAIIMRDSTLRLYYYLEIHRRIRLTMMIAQDLIENDFSTSVATVTNYNNTLVESLGKISLEFSLLNNLLVNSIHILDQGLITELFQSVRLTSRRDGEPDVIIPISGAAYEYMQMMVSIQNEKEILASNSAALYILKNTLNDILIRSEEIPQILLNAVQQLDDKVQNLLFFLIIGLIFIMTLISIAVIHTEFKYAREKSRFIYMLMRCDDRDLEQTITKLKDFYLSLGIKNELGRYSQINNDRLLIMKNGNSDKKGKSTSKRVITKGVNNASIIRILVSVCFLGAALAPLLASILIFQRFTKDINLLNNNLVSNDNLLSKYVLNYIGIYEYVSLNQTSSLRNRPITAEFQKDMKLIKDQFEFFDKIETGDPSNDKLITDLMSGNLCDYFKEQISDHNLCTTIGEGSATAGLFAITSYLTQIVTRIKLEFDSSDKTDFTIKQLLNKKELREAELIFDLMFQLPFFQIDSVLINSIQIRTDSFQVLSIIIDIVCIVVTVFFGAWGFKVYYIEGINERRNIRMMLKLFPPMVVKNQGKIRNYISSDFGNMFDS